MVIRYYTGMRVYKKGRPMLEISRTKADIRALKIIVQRYPKAWIEI